MAQFQMDMGQLDSRRQSLSTKQEGNEREDNNSPSMFLLRQFEEGHVSGLIIYSRDWSVIQKVDSTISSDQTKPWLVLKRTDDGKVYGGWWVEATTIPSKIAMTMGGLQYLAKKFMRRYDVQLVDFSQSGNLQSHKNVEAFHEEMFLQAENMQGPSTYRSVTASATSTNFAKGRAGNNNDSISALILSNVSSEPRAWQVWATHQAGQHTLILGGSGLEALRRVLQVRFKENIGSVLFGYFQNDSRQCVSWMFCDRNAKLILRRWVSSSLRGDVKKQEDGDIEALLKQLHGLGEGTVSLNGKEIAQSPLITSANQYYHLMCVVINQLDASNRDEHKVMKDVLQRLHSKIAGVIREVFHCGNSLKRKAGEMSLADLTKGGKESVVFLGKIIQKIEESLQYVRVLQAQLDSACLTIQKQPGQKFLQVSIEHQRELEENYKNRALELSEAEEQLSKKKEEVASLAAKWEQGETCLKLQKEDGAAPVDILSLIGEEGTIVQNKVSEAEIRVFTQKRQSSLKAKWSLQQDKLTALEPLLQQRIDDLKKQVKELRSTMEQQDTSLQKTIAGLGEANGSVSVFTSILKANDELMRRITFLPILIPELLHLLMREVQNMLVLARRIEECAKLCAIPDMIDNSDEEEADVDLAEADLILRSTKEGVVDWVKRNKWLAEIVLFRGHIIDDKK